jgi:hypothetical protein
VDAAAAARARLAPTITAGTNAVGHELVDQRRPIPESFESAKAQAGAALVAAVEPMEAPDKSGLPRRLPAESAPDDDPPFTPDELAAIERAVDEVGG